MRKRKCKRFKEGIIIFSKALIFGILLIVLLSFSPTAAMASNAPSASEPDQVSMRYHDVIYNIVYSRSDLGQEWSNWITWTIISYSYKHGVNPLLITAKYAVESNFRMTATSPVGAIGIAQLMPDTARAIGVDPYDPAQNIEGGIIYFRQQLDAFRYAGDWAASYAVAAYNAGPNAIREYNGIPPYAETINHLNRVGSLFNQLEGEFSRRG